MPACGRLHLLGPAHVDWKGTAVRGFESRKALALFCYLATTRQPTTRARLADLFWEDKTERRGRGNLSRVLHNIAHLMPGIVHGEPHVVELDWERVCTDVDAFTEYECVGDPAALRRAVELYRGEFLAGLDLDGCSEFAAWLDGQRERWRRRAAQALRRLVEHHTRRREHEAALNYAARLLELEPWCEEAHRLMMHALARSGQRTAALAQYEACRRSLARELGIGPSSETEALYRRIEAMGDLPPSNLPAQTTAFVGRETELAEIAGMLADPDCRLLTLVGSGGIGKTRLALRAARAEVGGLLDGVYFVPLRDVTAQNVLIPSIAEAIGLPLVGSSDAKRQLLGHLAGREMLLVLDGFKHVVPGSLDLIEEILRRAGQVKLLVTSRERLSAEGEWLYDVHGLAVPDDAAEEPPAEAFSAVRLFLESGRRVRPRLTVSPEDVGFITRICQRLRGLPLGIELAAAWLATSSLQEIAHEVQRDVGSLAAGARGTSRRRVSLRTLLEEL